LGFVESLRHHGNRSLSSADRNHVAAIVRDRPAVDLEIYFDYNSARISAQAIPQLNSLGTTLAAPEFKESVILIGGHTDSKGSDSYNQVLSERRAESVKRYLVEKFHLAAGNLVTAGYGKQDPKNAADPYGAENRRVQIGNLNAQARR
jgi:outer membrane protein OmpA-like peptidoglycan-associated protein